MEEKQHPLTDIADAISSTKNGDRSGWIVVIFLMVGFVISISVLGLKLVLARRKAAELASKVRFLEEATKKAKEDAALSDNAKRREAAQQEAKDAELKITKLKEQLFQSKREHDLDVHYLQSITSWDDMVIVDSRGK